MIHIGGKVYEIIHEHKNGWNPDAFRDRYSDVLDRYDYIVGDWGYNQLRLKGFLKDGHAKATKDCAYSFMTDYINEYCNFGCAYFVLEKVAASRLPEEETEEIAASAAPKELTLVSDEQAGRASTEVLDAYKDESAAAAAEPAKVPDRPVMDAVTPERPIPTRYNRAGIEEKPEPERAERPDKSGKPARGDRPDRGERHPDKSQRTDKSDRGYKPGERPNKPDRQQRTDRKDKPERQRSDKTEQQAERNRQGRQQGGGRDRDRSPRHVQDGEQAGEHSQRKFKPNHRHKKPVRLAAKNDVAAASEHNRNPVKTE
ncbi:YutD-like domain-containing protein [Paenibacillus protaetiae]|uniref:DUF1027 domain-containing protein n=1 Tax=Paenibacillus protaetiae TaxID=2509456 RepID=A0A4P6EUX4_9BACL|nr:YutD-like domain-containing protein [Paenibacillus protaetiae]QAY66792.1 DUF1027 domain-containing protein [Paenibacillus protaetiae]